MKVLENKAKIITASLLHAGYISEATEAMVYSIVITQLKGGGDYELIEDRTSIHVKSQARDLGDAVLSCG